MSLSVIVASSGRPTLQATLCSIAPQLEPGDELLVDVNADGDWGHRARNRMVTKATGDWLMFMDDDDEYVPGAFQTVRDTVALNPGRPHLFCMETGRGPDPVA